MLGSAGYHLTDPFQTVGLFEALMRERFSLSEDVRAARSAALPVVALETAVLTHGLPRPLNLEAFRSMEAAVRAEGAVPAAVCLLAGEVRVGMSPYEAVELANDTASVKVGLADLPAAAAAGVSGGTTVAATLWAARRAGIDVFATGGIGGVHRGAETSFDVSGDLSALARFGGCVVCSGAKAVLDLPKTFELLETLGVCVVTYGADEIPAFTCRSSGLAARHRVDTPEAAAAVLRARDGLGLAPAVLIAQPPPEEVAVPREAVEGALRQVLEESPAGQGLTPFLLHAVAERTAGATIAANTALLVENARLAARIARCLTPAGTSGGFP